MNNAEDAKAQELYDNLAPAAQLELDTKAKELYDHLIAAAKLRIELEKYKDVFNEEDGGTLCDWLEQCIWTFNFSIRNIWEDDDNPEPLKLWVDEEEARRQLSHFEWELNKHERPDPEEA